MLRPNLVSQLKKQSITAAGRTQVMTTATSWADYWRETFGDRFFDMGTFIRLGSAIEEGLRHFHREVSGKTHADQLIFQRLVKPVGLIQLFKDDCGCDLQLNPHFEHMREVMVHRHLFAHRSGLADMRYVDDLKKVTGEDIEPKLAAHGFPTKDVYWFEPLDRLSPSSQDAGLIEAARSFFRTLG